MMKNFGAWFVWGILVVALLLFLFVRNLRIFVVGMAVGWISYVLFDVIKKIRK